MADVAEIGDRAVPLALASLIRAIVRLETPGPLERSSEGASSLTESASPQWFAAAASADASLMEMAPELLANPAGKQGGAIDGDVDIIGIYAPESRVDSPAPEAEQGQPRSVRMDLLREILSLDA